MKKFLYLFLAAFMITGCASLPQQTAEGNSILAVSITTKAQVGWGTNNPTTVYFIRLNANEDAAKATACIESNYVKDDVAYLIDAKPGRYLAVAASVNKRLMNGMKYKEFAFLNKDAIKATEIVVKPNELAFMGAITLQNKVESYKSIASNGDDAQKNYAAVLKAAATEYTGLLGDSTQTSSLVSAAKTEKERTACLENAKSVFKDSAWIKIIK